MKMEQPPEVLKSQIKEIKEEYERFLEEITEVPIQSIETAIGNEKEHEEIKKILETYNKYKNRTKKNQNPACIKKFILKNGQIMTFGDFVVLNKIIESKMFRNNEGVLMVFDKDRKEFVPFRQNSFLTTKGGFIYRNNFKKENNNPERKKPIPSLESLAPGIFKAGIFKEEDFTIGKAGTSTYEIYGPNERKLSKNNPYVFFLIQRDQQNII